MTQPKTILISTLATSLLLLAGCTTQTATNTNVVNNTNSNTVVNTNTSNDNTNVVVTNSNENTNSEQGSEVDTSDWLTYTNEEYGFSFKYPKDWVLVESQKNLEQYETVSILSLKENENIPSALTMNISVSKQSLADLTNNVREYDKAISPVVFEDKLNIDGNEVIFIKKKGIDFALLYYFASLADNTSLRIEFFQQYNDVISTLKFQ